MRLGYIPWYGYSSACGLPPAEGQVCLSAAVSKAAVSMDVEIPLWVPAFCSSRTHPEVVLLRLTFSGATWRFPPWLHQSQGSETASRCPFFLPAPSAHCLPSPSGRPTGGPGIKWLQVLDAKFKGRCSVIPFLPRKGAEALWVPEVHEKAVRLGFWPSHRTPTLQHPSEEPGSQFLFYNMPFLSGSQSQALS